MIMKSIFQPRDSFGTGDRGPHAVSARVHRRDNKDILPGSVDDGHEAVTGGFVRFLQSGADTLVQIDRNGGADDFQTLAVLKGIAAATLLPDDVLVV
jgi:hypothetical protein